MAGQTDRQTDRQHTVALPVSPMDAVSAETTLMFQVTVPQSARHDTGVMYKKLTVKQLNDDAPGVCRNQFSIATVVPCCSERKLKTSKCDFPQILLKIKTLKRIFC